MKYMRCPSLHLWILLKCTNRYEQVRTKGKKKPRVTQMMGDVTFKEQVDPRDGVVIEVD